MKKLKCITSMLIATTLCVAPGNMVYAQVQDKTDSINQISETSNYSIELISEANLPEGITPKKVGTLEEINDFAKQLDLEFEDLTQPYTENLSESDSIQPKATRNSCAKVIQNSKTVRNGGPMLGMHFNVAIDYTYCYSYYGSTFLSCQNVSSFLSGVDAYASWEQTGYSTNIINGGTTLATTVHGKLSCYLLSAELGLVKLGTRAKTVNTNFNI